MIKLNFKLNKKNVEQLERENHILREKLKSELENHIDENIELKEKVRNLQIQLLKAKQQNEILKFRLSL